MTPLLAVLAPLLPIAGRAPSAHNTQPWQLHAIDADRVALTWTPDRWLAVTDPDMRDLHLSCGAFVESLLIVAHHEGIDLEFATDIRGESLGTFGRGTSYATRFTCDDLAARRTHRLRYLAEPVDAETRSALDAEAKTGAARLQRLPDEGLADLLRVADAHQLGNPDAAHELRAWTRLTASELTAVDGLTAPCLGLSRAQALALAAVLSPHLDGVRRPLGLSALTARFGTPIDFANTDVLALVGPAAAFADDPLAYGRLLMRLWLLLHRSGYATHPLSQLIDVEPTAAALAATLDVGADERLLSVFRVGRAAEASPESPRRAVPTA